MRRMTTRRKHRSGIVLLVVLSILSLFVVIGASFLIVTAHFRRGAESSSRENWYGDPPQQLLDAALYQVVRGTTDPRSQIGTNDLLSDLYGHDGFIARAIYKGATANTITLHVPAPVVDVLNNNGALVSPLPTDPQFAYVWRTLLDRSRAYFFVVPNPGQQTQRPALPGFYMGHMVTITAGPKDLRNVTMPIISYVARAADPPPVNPLPTGNPYPYAEIVLTWPNNAYQSTTLNHIRNVPVNSEVEILVNGRPYNGNGTNSYPDETYDFPDNANTFLADVLNPSTYSFRSAPPRPVVVDNNGDGTADGSWLDLGFPAQSSRHGRQVKPLISVLCLELDGRINLNFHGSPAHGNTPPSWAVVYGGVANRYKSSRNLFFADSIPLNGHGQSSGNGPPDVSLLDLLARIVDSQSPGALTPAQRAAAAQQWYSLLLNGNTATGIPGRYGATQTPGIQGKDLFTDVKHQSYLTARAMYDFHSALRSGFDPRGMPVFEPRYHADLVVDSPYETSADAPRGAFRSLGSEVHDQLFSLSDLEGLLRNWDWESRSFPSRLHQLSFNLNGSLLSANRLFRDSVTTESWHLPVLNIQRTRTDGTRYSSFIELLHRRFVSNPMPPDPRPRWLDEMTRPFNGDFNAITSQQDGPMTTYNPIVGPVVATELLYGHPLDINRPLTAPGDRQRLATQLYLLTLIVGQVDMADPNQVRRAAQWAINVVDFRDGDATMSAFEFDTNPFNGWDVDGLPFGPAAQDRNPAEREVIWGCERPDLLISETLAMHDVRVEDNNGQNEQKFRPRGSLTVEVHNPWATKYHQAELNTFAGGVQLNAVNANGAPVWRMEVVTNENAAPKFFVYFTDVTAPAIDPNIRVAGRTFYSTLNVPPIPQGGYGVVSSAGWLVNPALVPAMLRPANVPDIDGDGNTDFPTMIGMKTTDISPGAVDYAGGRRIQITQFGANPFLTYVEGITNFPPGAPISKSVPAAVINGFLPAGAPARWRSLCASEPVVGYPTDPNPLDPAVFSDMVEQKYVQARNPAYDDIPSLNAMTYFVRLQRLADPNGAFDATTNPYRVVDESKPTSIKVFNGSSNNPDMDPPDLAMRERANLLWSNRDWADSTRPAVPAGGLAQYFVTTQMMTTLGFLNTQLGNPETTPLPFAPPTDPISMGNEIPADFYIGGPDQPFPWLTWLDRPYMTQYELMQVPAMDSENLTAQFNTPSLYQAQPNFLHLYPFFLPNTRHYHVLHYTTARSRFHGTETYLGGSFPRFPRVREPGRVNFNTVPNRSVWESLWNGIEVTQANAGVGASWIPEFDNPMNANTIRGIRQSNQGFKMGELTDDLSNDVLLSTLLNAYPNSNYPHLNGDIHWYHRFRALNRMGNIMTTQSNVFAVWVTVGFFEIDANANVLREVGADTGEIRRHRAFYIIDRSIPVGFEPGENHNVDRAIVVRRWIE